MFPNELVRQQKARVRLAIGFAAAGLLVLGVLAVVQDFPSPFWLWALFAAAYVFFEWNTVEVNDKLYASPSAMVLMTAVVAFGYESAVLGAACMGALALVTPVDLLATIYHHLGINAQAVTFYDHLDRPLPLLDRGEPIRELIG